MMLGWIFPKPNKLLAQDHMSQRHHHMLALALLSSLGIQPHLQCQRQDTGWCKPLGLIQRTPTMLIDISFSVQHHFWLCMQR